MFSSRWRTSLVRKHNRVSEVFLKWELNYFMSLEMFRLLFIYVEVDLLDIPSIIYRCLEARKILSFGKFQ